MYKLRYVGPEPDCTQTWDFDNLKDIFLHVAEWAGDIFEEAEIDFDDPIVTDLISALKGNSYKKLIERVNALIYPWNCDYFECHSYKLSPKDGPLRTHEERMGKVFASVEKARVEWQKWKNELAAGENDDN